MNLLIVAATELEIAPFLQENTNVDILITGVGIPATVFELTSKLIDKNYDLALQAGIGGTFTEALQPGEVALISKDTFGDLGISENENFTTLFENGFAEKDDFPYKNGWLLNPHNYLQKTTLPVVDAITINTINNNELRIERCRQKFSAQVESMEGAAFHYVCLQQKINFLQVRSISNAVGERDKTRWLIKKAIENLNKELLTIMKNLT